MIGKPISERGRKYVEVENEQYLRCCMLNSSLLVPLHERGVDRFCAPNISVAPNTESSEADDSITVREHKKPGRKPIDHRHPRNEILRDLPEEQKQRACCHELVRIGIDISRQDMSNWTMAVAKILKPLIGRFQTMIRGGSLVQIDETPVQVMKEAGRKNTSKSFMWLAHDGPVVLSKHRSRCITTVRVGVPITHVNCFQDIAGTCKRTDTASIVCLPPNSRGSFVFAV
jgi:hypothetical protein